MRNISTVVKLLYWLASHSAALKINLQLSIPVKSLISHNIVLLILAGSAKKKHSFSTKCLYFVIPTDQRSKDTPITLAQTSVPFEETDSIKGFPFS